MIASVGTRSVFEGFQPLFVEAESKLGLVKQGLENYALFKRVSENWGTTVMGVGLVSSVAGAVILFFSGYTLASMGMSFLVLIIGFGAYHVYKHRDYTNLQETNEAFKKTNEALLRTRKKLKHQVHHFRDENTTYRNQNEKLSSTIANLEKTKKTLDDTCENYKEQNKTFEESIEDLHQEQKQALRQTEL
ncbi:MAG: hypothetical protein ACM3JI_04695, partial [Anaerolineae bacterium]